MMFGFLRVAGHFGELLQGRMGPGGRVALVTLPCPVLTVAAMKLPSTGLHLHVPGRLISLTQVDRLMLHLGVERRGRFLLRGNMPPGGGAGASTASLAAIGRLVAPNIEPAVLADACLSVEGATDPLMLENPGQLLWASRESRILASWPKLPEFEVVGGFHGGPVRTDPADTNFTDISDLIPELEQAALNSDLNALANVSTECALRNLALRGQDAESTLQLGDELGAVGIVIAHTGSARGLIFPTGAVPPNARERFEATGFSNVVQFSTGDQK